MESKNLILLGKIVRTHGYDGTLVISPARELSEDIEKMESVFVEADGLPVPFFISWSSLSPASLLLRFDGYESKEKVSEFVGCRIFIESRGQGKDIFTTLSHSLVGYSVQTPSGESIGTIMAVYEYPMQVMLEVADTGGKEILVPLHEDLVVSTSSSKRVIVMDLPEGITGINDGNE
ncbi:MAG: ribosome maturation factor RimM [Bacteroidales bacterium]